MPALRVLWFWTGCSLWTERTSSCNKSAGNLQGHLQWPNVVFWLFTFALLAFSEKDLAEEKKKTTIKISKCFKDDWTSTPPQLLSHYLTKSTISRCIQPKNSDWVFLAWMCLLLVDYVFKISKIKDEFKRGERNMNVGHCIRWIWPLYLLKTILSQFPKETFYNDLVWLWHWVVLSC